MATATGDQTPAAATSDQGPPPPPNLRTASEEDRECSNCVYYDNVHCTKFSPLCVDDEWVCDAWRAGGKDTDDQPVRTAAHTIREAHRVALTHARAQKAAAQKAALKS
jgi:hypothetical protein